MDLSGKNLSDFKTINIAQGVTLIADQSDIDSLHYIIGDGILQASTTTTTLNLAGKYVSLDVKDKDGVSDVTHGSGIYVEGDILIGTESSDILNGSTLSDRIEGGTGDDNLIGGEGNDIIRGGAGVDTMDGGAGDDRFVVVGDISGGGKIDSAEDTDALGFPLTNLNGKDLNEDENGAVEIIRGGDGDDTLYVYGTADLSHYDITGIEHIEIRSHVTFDSKFLEKVKSITGDGSSTIVLEGGSPSDPLVIDLTALDSVNLKDIGEIFVGENVILKIDTLDDLGGARILSGEGAVKTTADTLDLVGYTRTKGLDILNSTGGSISGGEILDKVITDKSNFVFGTNGDDYIMGKDTSEIFHTGAGNDVISGKAGDDIFFIDDNGTKIIIDSAGVDELNLSKLSVGANVNLIDGGTAGATNILLGSGSSTASKVPLDLFITEDLSGSFGDDVHTVRNLLDNLIAQIKIIQPDTRFGAGSFVDKPLEPFGDAGYGDYVYRTDSALSSDESKVKQAFDNMVVLSGNDWAESQLEALYQVALRTIKDDSTSTTGDDEIAFRSSAMRFVVLATDAPYHFQGDNASAGVNNGDTILDGTPAGSGEDYPSVAQVKEALDKANIYPVFAVTGGNESTYSDLVSQLGRGDVVNLSWDSSNLINSITTSIKDYKLDFIENLVGTNQNDILTGNSLDNRIDGGKNDDVLTGLGGDDLINGGSGSDIVIFRGTKDEYTIINNGIFKTVTDKVVGRDGVDKVYAETLRFSDTDLSHSMAGYRTEVVSMGFKVDNKSLLGSSTLPAEKTLNIFDQTLLKDVESNIQLFGVSKDIKLTPLMPPLLHLGYDVIDTVKFNEVALSMPFSYKLDLGSYDLDYYMESQIYLPESISKGDFLTIKTLDSIAEQKANFTINAPALEATLGLKLDLDIEKSSIDLNSVVDVIGVAPITNKYNLVEIDDIKTAYQFDFLKLNLSGKSKDVTLFPDTFDDDRYGDSIETVSSDKVSQKFMTKPNNIFNLEYDIGLKGNKMDKLKNDDDDKIDNLETTLDLASLNATFDIDDFIGLFAKPVSLFDGKLENTFGDFKIDGNYKILGLDLGASLSAILDFEFDPNEIKLNVVTGDGKNHRELLGDDIKIDTTGLDIVDGKLSFTTEYILDGDINIKAGVNGKIDLAMKALGAQLEISYKDWDVATLSTDFDLKESQQEYAFDGKYNLLDKKLLFPYSVWSIPFEINSDRYDYSVAVI